MVTVTLRGVEIKMITAKGINLELMIIVENYCYC